MQIQIYVQDALTHNPSQFIKWETITIPEGSETFQYDAAHNYCRHVVKNNANVSSAFYEVIR